MPFLAFLCLLLGLGPVDGSTVRVRLLELNEPRAVVLGARGGEVSLFAGDFPDPVATLADGQAATARVSGEQLHVELTGGSGLFVRELRVEPGDGVALTVAVAEGVRTTDAAPYSGRILVAAAGDVLELVNEVAMDDYVAAVVAREYGLDDLEGSKAMAVVARTYALRALNGPDDGYDLVDHVSAQMYQGDSRVTPLIRRAVEETHGEILTYRGEPIQAVYFSSSGGHTASNENVWRADPLPYLRGKPDPYDDLSPYRSWTSRVSRPKLLRALSNRFGVDVEGFYLGERTRDGRVATVELAHPSGRKAVTSNDFRMVILRSFGIDALRSTLFTAQRQGDVYVFEGRGFGHGVGLSQWGAHSQARQGKSYRQILDFYYTDVRLESVGDVDRPVASAPAPEAPVVPAAETPPTWVAPVPVGDARTTAAAPAETPSVVSSAPAEENTAEERAEKSAGGRIGW